MADTGLHSPSANGDDYTGWTFPDRAYSSNDSRTYPASGGAQHDYYDFTFDVPAGATIDGILVSMEYKSYDATHPSGADFELSWDGGASYTSSGYGVIKTDTNDTTETQGGAADLWGHAWSQGECSNTNFRLRLTGTGTRRCETDHLQVTIYYTEAVARRIFITHA